MYNLIAIHDHIPILQPYVLNNVSCTLLYQYGRDGARKCEMRTNIRQRVCSTSNCASQADNCDALLVRLQIRHGELLPLNAARPQLGQHHQLETFVPERHLCDRRVRESEVRRVCKRVQIDAQVRRQQESECAQEGNEEKV